MRVNSPGGSAFVSDVIWDAVEYVKSKKPIVVSMGDYAASGGYYISCAANYIFAEPTTITAVSYTHLRYLYRKDRGIF